MATGYIPASDAAFNSWLTNFSTLCTANFAAYGITSGQAASVAVATATWVAAYALATSPSTRTPATVADKDTARAAVTITVRPVAQQINNNPAVTDDQRAALGITIRKTTPTPIPAPTTNPVLSLVKALHLAVTLAFRDSASPTSKAKPYGVVAVEVWQSVGTVAATDPAQASYAGSVTKSPFVLSYDGTQVGKVATVWTRYVTRSGPAGVPQVGPWSPLLSYSII